MKKLVLTLLTVAAFGLILNAQDEEGQQQQQDDLTSKKGVAILPQSGDIAVGIDADPLIQTLGNFVKINSGAGMPAIPNLFNSPAAPSIYLKYFMDDKTAVRARIRIADNIDLNKGFVQDDKIMDDKGAADYNDFEDDGVDKQKLNNATISLMGGLEKRRGYGRLQGFYGFDAGIIYTRTAEKYTWHNPLSLNDDGITPSTDTANFAGTNAPVALTDGSGTGRVLDYSTSNFGIIADAFVGVEYFFAPKISVGGQFSWGFDLYLTDKAKYTYEEWNGTDSKVEETEVQSYQNSNDRLDLDTDATGSIFLLFHF